jgi:ADP-ribosylglycohydrolase
MRVSPVGYYAQTLDDALSLAKISSEVTHNHPEGIKGAQATAAAIFLARQGKSKADIKDYVVKTFGYNLDRTLEEIRPDYTFDETCQRTIPEALTCYLEGHDYEDVVRLAVSLAADADTLACIAGSISSATEDVPNEITQSVIALLSDEFCTTLLRFNERVAQRDKETL